jgi:hypothetical protein
MAALHVRERHWSELVSHMSGSIERAAFMLARAQGDSLTVFELRCLTDAQVDSSARHLLLPDRTRAEMIAWAWRSRAALIECHSHPLGDPAAFSLTDLAGLADWVPHARWRLQGAPYLALVHAPRSFDALTWTQSANALAPLEHVQLDSRRLTPTGLTFRHLCEHAT